MWCSSALGITNIRSAGRHDCCRINIGTLVVGDNWCQCHHLHQISDCISIHLLRPWCIHCSHLKPSLITIHHSIKIVGAWTELYCVTMAQARYQQVKPVYTETSLSKNHFSSYSDAVNECSGCCGLYQWLVLKLSCKQRCMQQIHDNVPQAWQHLCIYYSESCYITSLFMISQTLVKVWDLRRFWVCVAVHNGHIKRISDQDIQSTVLEVGSTNITTTFITCPADPKATLGIKLPFLVMIVKNMKKFFSFEVQVLDDKGVRRRFRASNYQVMLAAHHWGYETRKWNERNAW